MLNIQVHKGESGSYIAYAEEFPEITAQGDTESDARERLLRGIKEIEKNKEKSSDDNPAQQRTKRKSE